MSRVLFLVHYKTVVGRLVALEVDLHFLIGLCFAKSYLEPEILMDT